MSPVCSVASPALSTKGFASVPGLSRTKLWPSALILPTGLRTTRSLLARLCSDHGRRVAHVVADFDLDHLDLRTLTLRGGDRAQEEDEGGHDRGQTAAGPP